MSHRESDSQFEYVQRDERGSLELGSFAAKMALRSAGLGFLIPTWFKTGVVAGVVAGIGFAGSAIEHGVGIETRADLRAAESTSESKLLALNTEARLQVADAYFGNTLEMRGVKQIAEVKVGPLSKDFSFEYNTQLEGVGNITVSLPFDAITVSEGKEGATDFDVASNKAGIKYGWIAGSPTFKDFTANKDGTPNFGDRKGGWEGIVGKFTSDLQLLNIDGPANKMADLRTNTQHDIELAALESMARSCPPQLADEIYDAIRNAIRVNVASMQQDGKVGEIRFNGDLAFGKIEPPKKVQNFAKGNLKTGYNYGDPNVDKVSCAVDLDKIEESK